VALSCHVVVGDERRGPALLADIYQVLGARFGIDHATIQVEPESFAGQTPRSVCGACD
jgi:Co/Zn/Cd efflux system component